MAGYVIGNRVRTRRKQLGFSQQELAEMLGIRRPSISAIERGISRKSTYLLEMARALNVNPGWLTGETDNPSAQLIEANLTEILHSFSESEKEEALRFIQAWSLVKRGKSGL